MGSPGFAPWIGAIVCGAMIHTSAQAGGILGIFSHRSAGCDRPAEPGCQQPCPNCQNAPPKKKKVCCLCPPLPPQAPVGTSFAADPQAQFADNNPQDERLNKLDKDLSRLSVIVEQMLIQQQGKPMTNVTPQSRSIEPVPPGPVPAAARATTRLPAVQQVSAPAPTTATGQ